MVNEFGFSELKDELADNNGMSAAVSMRSDHKTIEMPIEKPEDWGTMNVHQKKAFITNVFLEKDLIKVEVKGFNLF